MSLGGKVAVVTGAAKGIGKAIAEIFLQNGAKVVLLDVDEPTGKRLKNGLDQQFGEERSLFMKCSVEFWCVQTALQSTIDTFGSINILCNNAGILREGDWEKTISINLGGVIRMTYAALEHMNKLSGGQGGVVVNTSSVAGLDPLPSCPAYSATKHGVVAFTRAMAVSIDAASRASEYGIRFNVVCPVRVQTDISSPQFLKTLDSSPTCLVPSEVAECVLDLVTDEVKNGETVLLSQSGRKYLTFPQNLQ
uniref:15-hydroxyprostaglandin dehydrogenase [NAD(+)] n=1 Tax=Oryzias latipes TaxID=8090 RepID=A0A3P9LPT5_ORYLA